MVTATDNLEDLIRTLPGYDPYAQAGEFTFWPDRAAAFIDFVEGLLTFSKGRRAGQPFDLEPWEKALFANVYGWWDHTGERRRYRHVLLMTGRGNGKSEIAAAFVCAEGYKLNCEPGAELYSVAAKQDQTRFVFDPVCRMIRAQRALSDRATIYKRSLVANGRSYRAICHSAGSEIGGAVQLAVADEVHAHPNRAVLDMLETGMVKRRNPLMLYVSTSDFEREGSPCNQLHDYGCKVRDGIVEDPTFLPAIFEAPKELSLDDPEAWRLANPNLGVAIEEQDLALLARKAGAEPAFENEFRRLHLNQRTEQATRVLPIERWDACRGELPDLRGRECWGGLDLGAVSDFCAFVPVFPLDDGRYAVKPIFWIPEAAAERRRTKLGAMYRVWERAGALRITSGNEVDYGQIEADIVDFGKAHGLREVAADRGFQGAQIVQSLANQHGITVVAHGQGWVDMLLPFRAFLEHVGNRMLVHDGNPVMRWMVSNLVAVPDRQNNLLPHKGKSADKIDGVVACIMGLGRAVAAGQKPQRSWYEDHVEAEVI